MALKHVVIRGFGFADGTKFIPTMGFSTLAIFVVPPWPASLPALERDTYAEQEPENVIQSSIGSVIGHTRERSRAGTRPVAGTWRLTRAQMLALDDFYTLTLVHGVKSFEWINHRTQQPVRYRFVSPLSYSPQAYDVWDVSAQLEAFTS